MTHPTGKKSSEFSGGGALEISAGTNNFLVFVARLGQYAFVPKKY